jgi:TonB family protein
VRNTLIAAAFAVFLAGPALAQTREVHQIGNGVTSPVLIREVKPVYTQAAMDRKVQGTVEVNAVILANGTVGDVTVKKSLDPDLDAEAIRAAKQWKFKPGTKDGEPVPVEVSIELSFTLRDGPTYKIGAGVTAPVLIKEVKPNYPDSVKSEGIKGTVEMEGTVEPDGTITGIRVTHALEPRLDEEAVRALRQWRFRPGQKDGVAVRVQVEVEMSFTVR